MKLRILILLVFLNLLITTQITSAKEFTQAQGYLGLNLYFKIEAPPEVSVNNTVEIKLLLVVHHANISVAEIDVWIYGCGVDERYIIFRNEFLTLGSTHVFSFTITPSEEGYLRLAIEAEYYSTLNFAQYQYSYVSLVITTVRTLTYSGLHENYTKLLGEHSNLLYEYSDLREKCTELHENYMYLLNMYEYLAHAYGDLSGNYSALLSKISQLLESTSTTQSSEVQPQASQSSILNTTIVVTTLTALLALITKPWKIFMREKRYW